MEFSYRYGNSTRRLLMPALHVHVSLTSFHRSLCVLRRYFCGFSPPPPNCLVLRFQGMLLDIPPMEKPKIAPCEAFKWIPAPFQHLVRFVKPDRKFPLSDLFPFLNMKNPTWSWNLRQILTLFFRLIPPVMDGRKGYRTVTSFADDPLTFVN